MTGLRREGLIKSTISFSILQILIKINKFHISKRQTLFPGADFPPFSSLIPSQPLTTIRPSNSIQCLSHAIELACLQIACSEILPYQQPSLRFSSITAKLVLPAHFLHLFIEFGVAAAHSLAQAPVGMVTS